MLKVWLPLNEDLHNQGCSNIAITNNGATVNASGKIGSCYAFNGSNQYLYTNYKFYNTQYSVCAWIYSTSASSTQTIVCDRTTVGYGFSIFLVGGKIRIDPGGNSIQWTTNYTYPINTWFHLSITYDGTKVSYYINGEFKQEYTCALASNYWGNTTSIGASQANGSGYGNYLNGRLNDIRIYDHCLSAAEVKEISQGLVLHYKLDSIDIKTGTNLVTSITKGGQTTLLTDGRIGVETSGTNADTYFTINLSESIVAGTSYFLSCDASGISAGQYWSFPLGQQNNGTLPFKIYNGHNEYAFTANDTLPNGNAMNWGTNRLFMDDNGRADWANKAQFYNFQLVKIGTGTELIAGDSSGYGHHGEIVNTLSTSDNTPRYKISTYFSNSAHIKTLNFNFPTNIWTVSCWYYKNTNPSAYEAIFCLSKGNGGDANKKIAAIPNTGRIWFKGESGSLSISKLNISTWTMLTMTCDGTTVKIYENSSLIGSFSAGSQMTNCTDLIIGARANSTNATSIAVPYTGSISDFRIYCTALSADDILQLYHTSAKIDNKKNLHTYELIENSSSIKINKRGQTLCNELQEGTAMKFYKTDSIIETNVLNEF